MRINLNDDLDYAFRRRVDEGDGPWEKCERCGYPAPLAEFFASHDAFFCSLCASIPEAALRGGGPEIRLALRMICHAANAILYCLGAFDAPERRG